ITVNTGTVQIASGGQAAVPETVFFSNNEQDVVVVLHEPLAINTQMTVTVSGVSDLAGNLVASSTTHFTTSASPDITTPAIQAVTDYAGNGVSNTAFSFTTSFNSDLAAPQVTGVSPVDSSVQIPINTQVVIGFNEPVRADSISQVTLSAAGVPVAVFRTLSNG